MPLLNSGPEGAGARNPGGPAPEAGNPAVPAGPPAAADLAGEPAVRALDQRRIALDRTVGAIVGFAIAFAHLLAIPIVWLTGAWPEWAVLLLSLAWPPTLVLLVWLAIRWPEIDYRYWQYRIDADGIQIWSGVIWRQAVAVPRSRVQHIDVSQGPLERSYGLATLSIYTAGTRYSKVDLPGLDHAVALALRDSLLPKDAQPAV